MQLDFSQKKLFWPFDPTPRVKGVFKDKIIACMLL